MVPPNRLSAARTGIDMDPLPVTGGIGKHVDARLRHLAPTAVAQMLTLGGCEFGQRGDPKVRLTSIRCD